MTLPFSNFAPHLSKIRWVVSGEPARLQKFYETHFGQTCHHSLLTPHLSPVTSQFFMKQGPGVLLRSFTSLFFSLEFKAKNSSCSNFSKIFQKISHSAYIQPTPGNHRHGNKNRKSQKMLKKMASGKCRGTTNPPIRNLTYLGNSTAEGRLVQASKKICK